MKRMTRQTLKTLALSTAVASLGMGIAAPVIAQTQAPEQAPMDVPTMTAETITEDQLDAFVTAFLGIEAVRQEYLPQIEAATTEAEQTELTNAANARIVAEIEAQSDFTPSDYAAILQAAQLDPELGAQLGQMIESRIQ